MLSLHASSKVNYTLRNLVLRPLCTAPQSQQVLPRQQACRTAFSFWPWQSFQPLPSKTCPHSILHGRYHWWKACAIGAFLRPAPMLLMDGLNLTTLSHCVVSVQAGWPRHCTSTARRRVAFRGACVRAVLRLSGSSASPSSSAARFSPIYARSCPIGISWCVTLKH